METNTALTAALLLFTTAFTASADGRKEIKPEITTSYFKTPAFEIGSPEDLNQEDIEKLKNMFVVKAPAFIWGSPDDAELSGLINNQKPSETKTVKAPEFVFGSPEDVDNEDVNSLKQIAVPLF